MRTNINSCTAGRMAIVLFSLVFLALTVTGCTRLLPPGAVPEPHRPAVNVFYVNETSGDGPALASMREYGRYIDEISPLWYRVRGDGSILEEPDPRLMDLARGQGIKVLPLFVLSAGGAGLLTEPAARERAAGSILRIVNENGFDGLNIDFEFYAREGRDYTAEREGFLLFMAFLREALGTEGPRLDASILPPWQPPGHLAPIHDAAGLVPLVDRVVLMAYDHSHPRSLPGAVAPLQWVEENIRALLEAGYDPAAISLGVAAYGYDWPAGQSGGIARSTAAIMEMSRAEGIAVAWDDQAQSPFLRYSDRYGKSREIWFENEITLEQKLQLVNYYRLSGISLWRLGYEEGVFWEKFIWQDRQAVR